MSERHAPPDFSIVIFGANGDLTRRLVVPALYNLARGSLLPEHFALIGIDHNDKSTEEWRSSLRAFLGKSAAASGSETKAIDDGLWKQVGGALSYLAGDFLNPETYRRLAQHLSDCEQEKRLGRNVIFYLATPDRFFAPVVQHLGQAGLLREEGDMRRRVIVEKPFGHDLESAKKLNQ